MPALTHSGAGAWAGLYALRALGVALFLAGYVGAVTGVQLLPFDRHHFLSRAGACS